MGHPRTIGRSPRRHPSSRPSPRCGPSLKSRHPSGSTRAALRGIRSAWGTCPRTWASTTWPAACLDIQTVADTLREETAGTLDLGQVVGDGYWAQEETRDMVIKEGRTATGAAYATLTFRSLRAAILAIVAIWRTWTSQMWRGTAWYQPHPLREYKVTVKFLMADTPGQPDHFGGGGTASRTAPPQHPEYRTSYRARLATQLGQQLLPPHGHPTIFDNPAAYPGPGHPAAAAAATGGAADGEEEEVEEVEEEEEEEGPAAWLGQPGGGIQTEDEFEDPQDQPRGQPWQGGPLAGP